MSSSDKFLWINLSEELIIVLIIISRLRIISSSNVTTHHGAEHTTFSFRYHNASFLDVEMWMNVINRQPDRICSFYIVSTFNTWCWLSFIQTEESSLWILPCLRPQCPARLVMVMSAAKTLSLRCYLLPGRLLTSSLGPRRDSINELFSS